MIKESGKSRRRYCYECHKPIDRLALMVQHTIYASSGLPIRIKYHVRCAEELARGIRALVARQGLSTIDEKQAEV